jgi:hypothetical protein
MWKDLLDKWHHNMFHEVLRIELVVRGHQIHDMEAFYPPHNRQDAFRSVDHRLGFCCHIIATNTSLCKMSRFKIESAFIPDHNFAKIVLLQNLEHWQKLTTFCQSCGLQLARQLVWGPLNMKVFHPQRVVQAVQHCCLRHRQDLSK